MIQLQWNKYNGKCGVCGDEFGLPVPRPNELGGIYGEGIITGIYKSNSVIEINVRLTVSHKGYFTFHLCNLDNERESNDCFNRYPLMLINGSERFMISTFQSGDYKMNLRLPADVRCNHCVLRWTYRTGECLLVKIIIEKI